MDRDEARAILRTHLQSLRQLPYAELMTFMGDVQVAVVVGPSGVEYQIEVEVMWDSLREQTNILVLGTIDDGHFRGAMRPVNESFIVPPNGRFEEG
jgi:hypothetical protein